MRRLRSTVPKLALVALAPFLLGADRCDGSPVMDFLRELKHFVRSLDQRVTELEACDCGGVLAPVCGEDGLTYVNRCKAHCVDVSVAHAGACETPVCQSDDGCTEDEFCEFGICSYPGGIELALIGECVPIPGDCPDVLNPVCGCDDVTYDNDCFRQQARVSKDRDGRCDEPPPRCGGIAGFECPSASQVCIFEPGTCDIADNMGACVEPPFMCAPVWEPVCGCDGETYTNECGAARAGVSIDYSGACRPQCGVPFPEAFFSCLSHRDCTVVAGLACCTCAMGGQQAAINRRYAAEVESYRAQCCDQVLCAQSAMCESGLTAVCEDRVCQLRGQAP